MITLEKKNGNVGTHSKRSCDGCWLFDHVLIGALMELEQFRNLILNKLIQGSNEDVHNAEKMFQEMAETNLSLLVQILISNSCSGDRTCLLSLTLLGRLASIGYDRFLAITDQDFHVNIQKSLIMLLNFPNFTVNQLYNVSHIISLFANMYKNFWSSLFQDLMSTVMSNSENSSTAAIDCISKCVNNESISIDQYGNQLFALIQTALQLNNNQILVSIRHVSIIRLIFSMYYKLKNQQMNTSMLAQFSIPYCIIIKCAQPDLISKILIELSNFADEFIDFFQPSFFEMIDILFSMINNNLSTNLIPQIAINSALSMLLQFFSCKSYKDYTKPLAEKSVSFLQLLLSVIQQNISEIDPCEGEDESNNTFLNALDILTHLTEIYDGYEDFVYNLLSLIEVDNTDLNPSVLSVKYIALKCTAYYIINDLDYPDYYEEILNLHSLGFQNSDHSCRYRSIKSFISVLKSYDSIAESEFLYSFNPSKVIPIIIDLLQSENIPIIVTAILKTLKTYFSIINPEYCDDKSEMLINGIIQLLIEKFQYFSEKQKSIIIYCFEKSIFFLGDDFLKFFQPIFNILGTIISNFQNYSPELFYSCLETIPSYSNLIEPDSFFSIESFILNNIINMDWSELSYKQIDIINYVIRKFIDLNQNKPIQEFIVKIVQMLHASVSEEIIPEIRQLDEDRNNLQNYTLQICPKENCIKCYLNSTIDSFSEFLQTIFYLYDKTYDKSHETMFEFIQLTLPIALKWLENDFSFQLAFKSAKIISALMKYPGFIQSITSVSNDQLNTLAGKIVLDIVHIVKLMDLEENYTTKNYIRLLIDILRKIGEFSLDTNSIILNENIINNIIDLTIFLYYNWEENRTKAKNAEDIDLTSEFSKFDEVEQEIGFIFSPIFKYFSNQFTNGVSILFEKFPLNSMLNHSDAVSPFFFEFYKFFVIYSPLCSPDQSMEVCSVFRECLVNNNSFSRRFSLESLLMILNSGKIDQNIIILAIQDIDSINQQKKREYSKYIILQLLILIHSFLKSQFIDNVNQLVNALIHSLPVNSVVSREYLIDSSLGLIALLTSNNPLLQNINAIACIINLILILLSQNRQEAAVKNQLKNYIKMIFKSSEAQQVFEAFNSLDLPNNDKKVYMSRINNIINE